MGKYFGMFLVKGIADAGGWEALLAIFLGLIGLALIVALVLIVITALVMGFMGISLYLIDLYENVRFWRWRKWGIKLPESWLGSTDKPEVSTILTATESGASESKKETTSTRMMRGLILVSVLLIVIVCICI